MKNQLILVCDYCGCHNKIDDKNLDLILDYETEGEGVSDKYLEIKVECKCDKIISETIYIP